jgi:Thioredoxin-like
MKKKYFLIFLIAFTVNCITVNGQIFFYDLNYQSGLQYAQKSGKKLLIQIETTSDCEKCNILGKQQFDNDALKKTILENFIPIYINTKSKDRELINNLYELSNENFGTLFVENNGDLLYKYLRTSTSLVFFKAALDSAYSKSSESVYLSVLQEMYNKSKNINDLEMLIDKRNERQLSIDKLLDEYITLITPTNNDVENRILFILKQSPILKSEAYNYATQHINYNKLWFSLNEPTRIRINDKIIFKSRIKAIKENDENYVLQLVQFIHNIYRGSNNKKMPMLRTTELLKTFYGANNNPKYFSFATQYLDNYFMTMGVDSINKIDSLNKFKIFNASKKNVVVKDTIIDNKTVKKMISSFSYQPISQNYTILYNKEAWHFYTKTKDVDLLKKALSWAERGYQHFKNVDEMDTYARLLYKLGNRKKAIEIMEERLQLIAKRKMKNDYAKSDLVYDAMLKNKDVIDAY